MTTHKDLLFKTAIEVFNHNESLRFITESTHISSGTTYMYVSEIKNGTVIIEFQVKWNFDLFEKITTILKRAQQIYPQKTNFMVHVEWDYGFQTENLKVIKKKTDLFFSEALDEVFDDSYVKSKIRAELSYWDEKKRSFYAFKKRKKEMKKNNYISSYDTINEKLLSSGYKPKYVHETGIMIELFDLNILFECNDNSLVFVSGLKNLDTCVVIDREIVDLNHFAEDFNLFTLVKDLINPSRIKTKEGEFAKTLNAILTNAFEKCRPHHSLRTSLDGNIFISSRYFSFDGFDSRISSLELSTLLSKLIDKEDVFAINDFSKKIRQNKIQFKLGKIDYFPTKIVCPIVFEKENKENVEFEIHVSDMGLSLYF